MDLGATIKNLRKQRGRTQIEFALKCGITQTYLSQIECNQKEPNLSVLKSIGNEMNVPLPIIFFLSMTEDDIHPNKRAAFDIVNPSVKSLVNEFFSV
jgi:transcriptional regulator with XRE-family HTH domain